MLDYRIDTGMLMVHRSIAKGLNETVTCDIDLAIVSCVQISWPCVLCSCAFRDPGFWYTDRALFLKNNNWRRPAISSQQHEIQYVLITNVCVSLPIVVTCFASFGLTVYTTMILLVNNPYLPPEHGAACMYDVTKCFSAYSWIHSCVLWARAILYICMPRGYTENALLWWKIWAPAVKEISVEKNTSKQQKGTCVNFSLHVAFVYRVHTECHFVARL